jgi:hypothetical protein
MNRAAWDLNENGPMRWTGTYKENQGPDEGAEAVPGTYTVRLTVDGVAREQRAIVQPDPRDPSSSKYQARYAFLSGLFSELGTINTMLNAIDARLKHATGSQASALTAFKLRLTYDPRNIEDLTGPAQIREKVLDLISRMSTSFQAPTSAQLAQAAAYRGELDALAPDYKRVMMVGP